MAVIRICETGWDSFTGDLGGIEFINGISVENLSERDCNRLGAGMRIESVDTGIQLGVGMQLAAFASVPMESENHAIRVDDIEVVATPAAPLEPQNEWTREMLEATADKGGIAAIREIADPLNIKGKSIAQLIDDILGTNA